MDIMEVAYLWLSENHLLDKFIIAGGAAEMKCFTY